MTAAYLRVQHDLGNHLTVRLNHSHATEQLFKIVWKVGATSVTRIHSNENALLKVNIGPSPINICVIPYLGGL
jgi:hypothetical protein